MVLGSHLEDATDLRGVPHNVLYLPRSTSLFEQQFQTIEFLSIEFSLVSTVLRLSGDCSVASRNSHSGRVKMGNATQAARGMDASMVPSSSDACSVG